MIKRIARRNFTLVTLSFLVLQVPAMGRWVGGGRGGRGLIMSRQNLPDFSTGFFNILMIPLIGS